jgi:hypothetical protein
MHTSPHGPQAIPLIIGIVTMTLIGCAALVAAHLARKSRRYRSYRSACISFACLSLLAAAGTLLQVALPICNQQPYATWLNVSFLALAGAISASFLCVAHGRHETTSLSLILAPTLMLLVGDIWPALPAPPPLTELAAAYTALGTVLVLPYWLAWRLLHQRLTGRPSPFTLRRALGFSGLYGACAIVLFVALCWHGHHPTSLPSAFGWAGVANVVVALLLSAGISIYALYRRGRLQRWLSEEQQRS